MPVAAAPIDPAIAAALREVSPQAMRHSVERLLTFSSRNTLTSTVSLLLEPVRWLRPTGFMRSLQRARRPVADAWR